jgi:hypothetical protein
VQQRFGGYTALIQAHAAKGAFLYKQHIQPGVTGTLGGHIPAGTPADYNKIKHLLILQT